MSYVRFALLTGLLVMTNGWNASAQTCPFVITTEDDAVLANAVNLNPPLSTTHNWYDFISQYYLTDGSWSPFPWNPPNIDTLHPPWKLSEGFMMVGLARYDSYGGWHPASQYADESWAIGSRFHDNITWQYNDTTSGTEALTTTNLFQMNTSYWCQLFGTSSAANSPTERGAVIVHEAWHAWQYDHGWDGSHRSDCPAGTASCDWYYPHTQIEYLPGDSYTAGDLDIEPVIGWRFHSPYQLASEYECDVSQFSRPWVPLGITGASGTARFFTNFRNANNFSNAVAWKCGNPLPFD